ncbi:hypothetical protein BG011_004529 [Mortierella polycephala]|uniref:WD40 repeat-like protein n=1 Tax=Mortierella polycephala TaxID=41804 RepID=A0A9P6QIP7_9FUNG|nr:hypothetical protein BG011_004529 [Mortierella polycephala]
MNLELLDPFEQDFPEVIEDTLENGPAVTVRFNRRGTLLAAGCSDGTIVVWDFDTRGVSRSLLGHVKTVTSLRDIVVNANDRVIRLFATKEDGPPEQLHKFQDLVNRIQWNQCCLSSDSDYVIGGSAHQAEHNIYIWDKIDGNLVKILEGPKEPLEDLAWHPIRPIIASVSSYGTIYIWATNYQENWSAFAPDFKELEENIDYEEREDEFDIVPEEEASKRKHDDEDVIIDVTTIEKINPFNDSDSDDGQEEMFYLPLLPSDQRDEELLNHKHHQRSRCHHNRNRNHGHHREDRHRHNQQESNNVGARTQPNMKNESIGHVKDNRRRDHRDRDHDRNRDRERDRDRDGDRDRDQNRERGEKSRKQRQRSDDDDDYYGMDVRLGHGYENGNGHGNGYDHDQSTDKNHPRRRLEDQPASRSIKRQR